MNRFLPALCVAAWLGVLGWAATIFAFSSMSGQSMEQLNTFDLWDKAAHFVAFAVGGVLLALAFRFAFTWPKTVIFRRAVLILALYAASDEWHQTYTPGRSGGDVRDWIADLFGCAAGAAAVVAMRRPTPAVPEAKSTDQRAAG